MDAPTGFVRFVIDPHSDMGLVPDLTERLPGRGAWVLANRDALEMARTKGAFARSFKRQVLVEDTLGDLVAHGLRKLALNALGLARRSGDAVLGYEKVRAALKSDSVAVLLTASDAGNDSAAKLAALANVKDPPAARISLFSSAELTKALGGENVVHVALKSGGPSSRFLREARRATGFE